MTVSTSGFTPTLCSCYRKKRYGITEQAEVTLEIWPRPTELEFFRLSWVPEERLGRNIVHLDSVDRVER